MGSAPRCVPEHAPESRRVYCTEQEFLPAVVSTALNQGPELSIAHTAQGETRLRGAGKAGGPSGAAASSYFRGRTPTAFTYGFCKSLRFRAEPCARFSPPRLNKSGVFLCCLHWRGWRFRTAELQTWWPSDRFCCVPIFFWCFGSHLTLC